MKRIIYSIIVAGLFIHQANAQPLGYYQDALLFSRTNAFGSSARTQGIGGVQTSLGGDISNAGSNPAGLGFFNRSVFAITPAANFHDTKAQYGDNGITSYQPNLNLPNIGVVFNSTIGDIPKNKFKGGSFAFSITRINDFNQQFAYEGYSPMSSIGDAYAENAGSIAENNLPEYEYAAYSTYLIDPIFDNSGNLTHYDPAEGLLEPFQSERVETTGGQNQINFSWGGNYDDKFYFGAGLGIQTLRYKRTRYFTENDYLDNNNLNSLVIEDELAINGTGINATFGMIVRPIPFITMGVSYTTPTYYSLDDESAFNMTANWNNFQHDDETTLNTEYYASPISTSEYNLRTPERLNLGASVFIGKFGFFSADVEYVDYSSAVLQSNTASFDMNDDNTEVSSIYASAVNYRLGGEFRMDVFRFRAGYAYLDDPFRNPAFDQSRSSYTFGIGFRQKDFFIDLGVVQTTFDELYTPYEVANIDDQPVISVENENTTISATLGINF